MFEQYVERQCQDNTYDLEANLALLKLYQFNPSQYNQEITQRILLKAITNLPHTDIILCKCLLASENVSGACRDKGGSDFVVIVCFFIVCVMPN